MERMDKADVRTFLFGKTLFVYEPETLKNVAKVTYYPNGCCMALFTDGTEDTGQYGLSGETYWTQYERFRENQRHHFYLTLIEPEVAQAFYIDGRRAFLQSPVLFRESSKRGALIK